MKIYELDTASKIAELLAKFGDGARGTHLGKLVAHPVYDAIETLNFTLPKGKGTSLWMSFLSALDAAGYNVQKFDESLEISPVDQPYYAITQKQKEEMEARIKSGLASVASAVSDYEMLAHDLRKFKELLKMFETEDEHSLRAIFIDEVDINTGANSIKQMVVRWPTIIADFMTLGEKMPEEIDVDKIKDELKISKAEAVILSTKQRLYKNWKELFGSEVKDRVERLWSQVNSRKKSIEAYKEWLKPLVARHKLYKEGLSTPESRKSMLSHPFISPGQAVSLHEIEVWAWQPIMAPSSRESTKEIKEKVLDPYDNWIKEKVIFNEERGLKKFYSWISEEWVGKKVEEIKKDWLEENALYYVLHQLKLEKYVIRIPDGTEIEDVTIYTQAWFFSQNALLAFLLELKIKQEEFEREIDQLLGITSIEGEKISEKLEETIKKWKKEKLDRIERSKQKLRKLKKGLSKLLEILGLEATLSRFGPYEHNFKVRITNFYLINLMKNYYNTHVIKFLLEEVGVGK